MKRAVFLLTGSILSTALCAQKIDSSFHNYWFDSRSAYFRQLPEKKKPVVFLGDSITEWADWNELTGLGNVLNRGIAGDISFGLLHRIDEVIRHRPKQLFILVGTNDISKGIPCNYIVNNYKQIILKIKKESPQTGILVQSVLPINDSIINRQFYKGTNVAIVDLNKALKQMAKELNVVYIDIFTTLVDEQQQLAKEYTYDGLHLSGKGYLQWVYFLKQHRLLKN